MKVVVGFSGGVDSAVTAALLKRQGYAVHGLYLDNAGPAECEDAIRTAEAVGIPLAVRDIKRELEEQVCKPFTDCYLRGETPNPCILCNPAVKFRNLLEEADALGAEWVATGHYARAENGALYKGRPANDQSYMLCRLTREQLQRLLLPLGGYEKQQVRALAEELALPVAHKPDSMEICFIPDKDYIAWLGSRTALPPEGELLYHGQVIGRHRGIYRCTVGQRWPGLLDGRKVYVSRIDAAANSVELALWEELFRTEVTARDFHWLIDPPEGPVRASVRVRHTRWENPPCTARVEGELVRIACDEPVRAPAAGQSAVLYDGERLLGGGFIMTI
jgi:tRNA-specific 2-thiouridylase